MKIQNRHGHIIIEPASATKPIHKIVGEKLAKKLWFNVGVAEQIKLITENCAIQIGYFNWRAKYLAYLVVHEGPDRAWVARVKQVHCTAPIVS